MKVYIVLQRQFTEENFGDLGGADSIFHGVFSTPKKAEEYIKTIKVSTFKAQFGSNEETLHTIESEIDIPNVVSDWCNEE